MCPAHHRTVHEGGYRIRADASGELNFLRPDNSVLPEVPRRPAVSSDPLDTLMARNKACGQEITPETNRAGWGGEELDLVWAVEGILQSEGADTR